MPLDKFVLIIVTVIGGAALTVYVGLALVASMQLPPLLGFGICSVIALGAYVFWRVIAERVGNEEDDHYDRFEN
ncbi:hypothetical protein [Yoonia sp. BS5-3]|uniref:Uncharacterized protein n=1 Tax=Yoonia phaeophyticola TaxID=3137369 RepID=A0ABZ2V0H3_9RHOB